MSESAPLIVRGVGSTTRKRSLQSLSDILRRKPEVPPKETPAQKPAPSEENKEQN